MSPDGVLQTSDVPKKSQTEHQLISKSHCCDNVCLIHMHSATRRQSLNSQSQACGRRTSFWRTSRVTLFSKFITSSFTPHTFSLPIINRIPLLDGEKDAGIFRIGKDQLAPTDETNSSSPWFSAISKPRHTNTLTLWSNWLTNNVVGLHFNEFFNTLMATIIDSDTADHQRYFLQAIIMRALNSGALNNRSHFRSHR